MSTQEQESEGPVRKMARLEGEEEGSEGDPGTEKEESSSFSSDVTPCKFGFL